MKSWKLEQETSWLRGISVNQVVTEDYLLLGGGNEWLPRAHDSKMEEKKFVSTLNNGLCAWIKCELQNNFLVSVAIALRLPDVLERPGLSLNLLSKPVMSLVLEKYFLVLEYFRASLKVLQQLRKFLLLNYWLQSTLKNQD